MFGSPKKRDTFCLAWGGGTRAGHMSPARITCFGSVLFTECRPLWHKKTRRLVFKTSMRDETMFAIKFCLGTNLEYNMGHGSGKSSSIPFLQFLWAPAHSQKKSRCPCVRPRRCSSHSPNSGVPNSPHRPSGTRKVRPWRFDKLLLVNLGFRNW